MAAASARTASIEIPFGAQARKITIASLVIFLTALNALTIEDAQNASHSTSCLNPKDSATTCASSATSTATTAKTSLAVSSAWTATSSSINPKQRTITPAQSATPTARPASTKTAVKSAILDSMLSGALEASSSSAKAAPKVALHVPATEAASNVEKATAWMASLASILGDLFQL